MIYIVMGVSGCGKTTIGKLLAERLNLPFFDADDYHSEANIQKMSQGIPLTDNDRTPWLLELAKLLEQNKDTGAVLACSALKEKYREVLKVNDTFWVFLEGDFTRIYDRLCARKNHYMSSEMLKSQLETLEKPSYGLHLDVSLEPDKIVNLILEKSKK